MDFFDVTAWRELGEAIANYKKKGDPVLVEGRLQYRSWEAEDGSKRSKVDVVADNVQFLGRGSRLLRQRIRVRRRSLVPPHRRDRH